MALSKYNKIAEDEDDLELPYTDNQYRDRAGLDAESNNYSIDDEDGSYDDDDEEVAIQSPQLRRASTSRSSRSKCCITLVVFLTLLVGLLAGGKVYVDEYGVPDEVQGFYGQLRGKYEDWKGSKGGDEQIDALMNEDFKDEKVDDVEIQEINIGVTPPTTNAEESADFVVDEEEEEEVVEEQEEEEEEEHEEKVKEQTEDLVENAVDEDIGVTPPMTNAEESAEFVVNQEEEEEVVKEQEEELEEEHDEKVEEQNKDLVENAVDEELVGDNQNLDYMLGATGMISNEWSVIEQVDHDRTSFT